MCPSHVSLCRPVSEAHQTLGQTRRRVGDGGEVHRPVRVSVQRGRKRAHVSRQGHISL